MNEHLIMTLLGTDRSGLVRDLAATVAAHGASWQESKMARMAGQFAGILRVDCPPSRIAELSAALQALASEGLSIQLIHQASESPTVRKIWQMELVANDRPGIVHELTDAISRCGGNVEEWATELESAAMAGHPLFRASCRVSLPDAVGEEQLRRELETLSDDLSVEIH
jgi:glycine cleavage system regulatory protein